jgi:hypothetical protein
MSGTLTFTLLCCVFDLETTILSVTFSVVEQLGKQDWCLCAGHEGIWGSRGTAPIILKLNIQSRSLVTFTTRPLYPLGNSLQHPLTSRLSGHSRSGHFSEEKNILPFGHTVHILVTVLAMLSWLTFQLCSTKKTQKEKSMEWLSQT